MYEKFFYLKENPFHITPDPKFFYPSKKHQEAIDLLLFGISRKKGFLLLDGEVGTGKTTIWRTILNKPNGSLESALILNPLLSDIDLLKTINEDFGIRLKGSSMKEYLDALNAFLLEKAYKGGNAVVIIDEAQNLNPKALEMIRLLSNLETEKMKLLQIVLIGQPELRDKLKMPELRQLNQRILIRYRLKSLDVDETREYIFSRLNVAGGKGNVKFTPQAIQIIYKTCEGVPRMINAFCDRALTAAFVDNKRIINRDIANRVKDELDAEGAIKKEIGVSNISTGIARYARFLVQPVRMLRQRG
jgi:general secretion pathway protein A